MEQWIPPNSKYPPPKAGEPALHRAARVGDHAEIRRLVAAGADNNAEFDIGLDPDAREAMVTPLMVAAGSGDGATVETVRLLMELGADAKHETDFGSAAVLASTGLGWNYRPGGDAERLEAVLDAGSPLPRDPEDANRYLCDSAALGDARRLEVLLRHGLDARGYWDAGRARERHLRGVEQMRMCAAKMPDLFASVPGSIWANLEESRKQMEQDSLKQACSGPSGWEIPLFRAAESGNIECVKALVEAGADVRVRDNSARTAMYEANSREMVALLHEAGVPLEDADKYGWSPLVAAVIYGREAIRRIRALIDVGADVNATREGGYSVFMSAVGAGRSLEVIQMLIEAGANPHAETEHGSNAFHAAIDVNGEANDERSVRETFTYLKAIGVDIEKRTQSGITPLGSAVLHRRGIETHVLCDLGANPNSTCPEHRCGDDGCAAVELPLLFHVARGSGLAVDEKAEALLKAGADVLATDRDGHTPLVHAVAALCREGADYERKFREFFVEVCKLKLAIRRQPLSRVEFVAAVTPQIRAYVEAFAVEIPMAQTSQFEEQWRHQRVGCIAMLCTYECWARHEHSRRGQA